MMFRETKVGVMVSLAFLCLAGSVVYLKLQPGNGGLRADSAPVAEVQPPFKLEPSVKVPEHKKLFEEPKVRTELAKAGGPPKTPEIERASKTEIPLNIAPPPRPDKTVDAKPADAPKNLPAGLAENKVLAQNRIPPAVTTPELDMTPPKKKEKVEKVDEPPAVSLVKDPPKENPTEPTNRVMPPPALGAGEDNHPIKTADATHTPGAADSSPAAPPTPPEPPSKEFRQGTPGPRISLISPEPVGDDVHKPAAPAATPETNRVMPPADRLTPVPAGDAGSELASPPSRTPGSDAPGSPARLPSDTPSPTPTPGTDTPAPPVRTPGSDAPGAPVRTPGSDIPGSPVKAPGTDTPGSPTRGSDPSRTMGTDGPGSPRPMAGSDAPGSPVRTPGTDAPGSTSRTPEVPARTPAIPVPMPAPIAVSDPRVESFDEQTHVCQAADTLQAISTRYYQNSRYERALLMFNRSHPQASKGLFNDPPVLQPGQAIFIPPVSILMKKFASYVPDASALPGTGTTGQLGTSGKDLDMARIAASSPRTYKVQPGGQKIWEIAKQTLGKGERWAEIAQLNPSVKPENVVPEGTLLQIPN